MEDVDTEMQKKKNCKGQCCVSLSCARSHIICIMAEQGTHVSIHLNQYLFLTSQ